MVDAALVERRIHVGEICVNIPSRKDVITLPCRVFRYTRLPRHSLSYLGFTMQLVEPIISTAPPELFPIIASFIPLRSASQTLLALPLPNRRHYAIVRPLIYSRLILRNEHNTIVVVMALFVEPELKMAATQIHLMSELSSEAREGVGKAFYAVVSVRILVSR